MDIIKRLTIILFLVILPSIINVSTLRTSFELAGCGLQKVVEPTFEYDKLDDEATWSNFFTKKHQFRGLHWPDDLATPITFAIMTEDEKPNSEITAMVQIVMAREDFVQPLNGSFMPQPVFVQNTEIGIKKYSPELKRGLNKSSLFNCYVDRSAENPCTAGRVNPRSCYHRDSKLGNLSRVYPEPQGFCADEGKGFSNVTYKDPCQAICYNAFILQVEFGLNKNASGGRTTVSAVYKQIRMLQDDSPTKYEFKDITDHAPHPIYSVGSWTDYGSTLNGDIATGFWIRWTPKNLKSGPFLEIGRDGEEIPYHVHDFREHCFNCTSQDQYGWAGTDVQLPLLTGTFQPLYWYANGIHNKGNLWIGLGCNSIVYTRYQDQYFLGGTCIVHSQCRNWCGRKECFGRHCLLAKSELVDLTWRQLRTCQLGEHEKLPRYILILIILGVIILIVAVALLAFCVFYLGTVYPKRRIASHKSAQIPALRPIGPIRMQDASVETLERTKGLQIPHDKHLDGEKVQVPNMDEEPEEGGFFGGITSGFGRRRDLQGGKEPDESRKKRRVTRGWDPSMMPSESELIGPIDIHPKRVGSLWDDDFIDPEDMHPKRKSEQERDKKQFREKFGGGVAKDSQEEESMSTENETKKVKKKKKKKRNAE